MKLLELLKLKLKLLLQLLKIMQQPFIQSNLEKWADGIQESEGWVAGSRSYRNHNPGNLKYAGQAGTTGPDKEGFCVFINDQLGFHALVRQLGIACAGQSKAYSPDMTLKDFTIKYAQPKSEQALENYLKPIISRLGVPSDIQIKNIV